MYFIQRVLFVTVFMVFSFSSLSYSQISDDKNRSDVVKINWKKRVIGKRVQKNDGVREVKLHNGKTYSFTDSMLIEEIEDDNILTSRNVYDFDNGVLIHEFNGKGHKGRNCPSLITPFGDLSSRKLEEKISLSCFILGDWFSLVNQGKTKNPFYHDYCKGRYDGNKH